MTEGMGVYRRGPRWYARLGGRRISLGPGVTTRVQAQAVYRELEKRRLEGKLGLLDPSRVTLGQFTREYLAHREPLNLSPETKRRDGQALRSLAEVVGSDCLLRAVNQRRVDQWAGVLLARGVKPQTVNSYLRHIKATLSSAAEWGQLQKAPRLKPLREPRRLPRHLAPEDLDHLLRAEANPERRSLWTFLIWTGLRRQEAVDLTWPDVHLGDKPFIRVIGKGDKERLVPLLPKAVEALGTPKDIGPVWQVGHPDNLSHWFKAAARRADLPGARLHDLRHTAATYMVSRGVSLRMAQAVLGHASIVTTEQYSRGLVADLYDELSRGLE